MHEKGVHGLPCGRPAGGGAQDPESKISPELLSRVGGLPPPAEVPCTLGDAFRNFPELQGALLGMALDPSHSSTGMAPAVQVRAAAQVALRAMQVGVDDGGTDWALLVRVLGPELAGDLVQLLRNMGLGTVLVSAWQAFAGHWGAASLSRFPVRYLTPSDI